jgi:hypothetical protein
VIVEVLRGRRGMKELGGGRNSHDDAGVCLFVLSNAVLLYLRVCSQKNVVFRCLKSVKN